MEPSISSTKKFEKIYHNEAGTVYKLLLFPNGDLAAACSEKQIIIWDTREHIIKRRIDAHFSEVYDIVLLDNGYMASASADRSIKIWSIEKGSFINILRDHLNHVTSMAVVNKNKLVSSSSDGTMKLWNIENGELLKSITFSRIYSYYAFPNGELAVGKLGYVDILDTTTNDLKVNKTLSGYYSGRPVKALDVLPNGDFITGSYQQIITWF
jgi:WD40 repeat protein